MLHTHSELSNKSVISEDDLHLLRVTAAMQDCSPEITMLETAVALIEVQMSISSESAAAQHNTEIRAKRLKALLLLSFWTDLNCHDLARLYTTDIHTIDSLGLGLHTTNLNCPALLRLCPVRALSEWTAAAGIDNGPVFRRVDASGKISTGAMHPAGMAATISALLHSMFCPDRGVNVKTWNGQAGWHCNDPRRTMDLMLEVGFGSIEGRGSASLSKKRRHRN